MKVKWDDITSYSQNDKKREPSTWAFKAGAVTVVVTRYHGCPDQWFLRCDAFGFNLHQLMHKEINEAKWEALGIVWNRARVTEKVLGDALSWRHE